MPFYILSAIVQHGWSYSSDEENLNVESSDDLDSEVESFTGYGNEPEYTEQEISILNKLILSVVV